MTGLRSVIFGNGYDYVSFEGVLPRAMITSSQLCEATHLYIFRDSGKSYFLGCLR